MKTLITQTLLVGALAPFMVSANSVSSVAVATPDIANWHTMHAPSERVVWLGGDGGKVAMSANGGESFETSFPGGQASDLHVRQLFAIDDRHAYALTSGRGERSRLYVTRNGGFSWRRLYRGNGDEELRCFALIPDGEGWVLGDNLHDSWHVVRTSNGNHWLSSRSGFAGPAMPGEQASNVSDSCARFENNTWLMGTKNGRTARIIYKARNALRFQVADTPLRAGAGAGVSAVWPLDSRDFLIAGGDEEVAELYRYRSGDFEALEVSGLTGAIQVLHYRASNIWVGNANGLKVSNDYGASWREVEGESALAMQCVSDSRCWLLNGQGELKQLSF
ncbi:MAG: hypothetical protein JJU10_07490 [Idiomarina sp.]|nr:hypothetical protein [Idiomarina sp.]